MLCLTYQLIRQMCSWTFRVYRWVRKNDKTLETIIQNHASCDMKFLAQPKTQRHSSIMQSWPKVGTIQMLIYWWISRQKLTQIWYPWKEAVDSYRRDGSTCTNPWTRHTKYRQLDRKTKYSMIWILRNAQNRQIHKVRTQVRDHQKRWRSLEMTTNRR